MRQIFRWELTCLVAVALAGSSCGGSSDTTSPTPPSPPPPARQTNLATIVGTGITGHPTAGLTQQQAGQLVTYSFSANPGFTKLQVFLDGQTAADSGTVRMDTDHALMASADRNVALAASDVPKIADARVILTAPDPAVALQASITRGLALVAQLGVDSAARLENAVNVAAFDPVADSSALRRIALALDRRVFVVDDSAAGVVTLRSLSPPAVRPNRLVPRSYRSGFGTLRPSAAMVTAPSDIPLSIIFVNGVNNSPEDAKTSFAQVIATAAGAGIPGRRKSVLYYNASEMYRPGSTGRCLTSFAESFFQSGPAGWANIALHCTFIGDFSRAGKQILDVLGYVPGLQNDDAKGLATLVLDEENQGRAVVILGHSQGTIITSQAVQLLVGSAPTAKQNPGACLGVISVAVPLTYAGGPVAAQSGVAAQGDESHDLILDTGLNPAGGQEERIKTQFTDYADTYQRSLRTMSETKNPFKILASLALVDYEPFATAINDYNLHNFVGSYLGSDAGRRWVQSHLRDEAALVRASCVSTIRAPALTSVTPNSLTGSSTMQQLILAGTAFVSGATVTVQTGSIPTVLPITQTNFKSPTEIDISVNVGTSPASWTVSVTNPDGQVSNTASFSVTAPATPPPLISRDLFTIAPNNDHTCTLNASSRAYCWGQNIYGILGNGAATPSYVPAAVAGGLTFTSIVTGYYHSCALGALGTVSCWGSNDEGQLGTGTTANSNVPIPVAGNIALVSLVGGSNHTCGLVADGTAYCWGFNRIGQSGIGSQTEAVPTPTAVATSLKFASLAAGELHSCGLTQSGVAYCWGDNTGLQLGTVVSTTCTLTTGNWPCAVKPVAVNTTLRFTTITAGGSHTCGLTESGAAYCWGSTQGTYVGQTFGLGDGTENNSATPVRVASGLTFTALAAGREYTCGLVAGGQAYCWGDNRNGQLGNVGSNQLVPTQSAVGLRLGRIAAGWNTTCGRLASDATVYCWGWGPLGDGSTAQFSGVPARVQVP